jgi:prepilin-type N-terminal cleavage/methylation domain-containing protein
MSTRRRPARTVAATAFTLIELIVVIAIIAILASIALVVGGKVTQTSRANLTKQLLMILDNTQTSFHQDRDSKVPFKYTDESAQKNEFGIVDGRIEPGFAERDRAEPSVTFYLLATREAPSVQSATGNFDARFVVRSDIIKETNALAPAVLANPKDFSKIITYQQVAPQTTTAGQAVAGLVIKDPWGNAIRFVHPKFDGGYGPVNGATTNRDNVFNTAGSFKLNQNGAPWPIQFRRSMRPGPSSTDIGDADEGLCRGTTGYFYSPGLDGDPGTKADNVYMNTPPTFPKETANVN